MLRILALLCFGHFSAQAAHTHVRLLLNTDGAPAGDTILAGVHLQMDPGWHTYWKNPGNSGLGMATAIEWQLPKGITAGPIQWPIPRKLADTNNVASPGEDSTTYFYEDEVTLLVPLKLEPGLKPDHLDLNAKVSWLECASQCLFATANVTAPLEILDRRIPSKNAELIASWEKKLPRPADSLRVEAWWEKPPTGDYRPLALQWTPPLTVAQTDFFPYGGEGFEIQGATQLSTPEPGKFRILKQVKKVSGTWPTEVSGLLIGDNGKERLAYEVKVTISSGAAGQAETPTPPPNAAASLAAPPIWKMLIYAFLGGLILNVMPCVLPVIALKILGFVSQAKDDPRRIRKLGLIYGLGVVMSFLIMAGAAVGLKLAGQKVGWGMQFSSPQFIVGLTILVTLVSLNLFGLFEFNLPGRVLDSAGKLSSKHGSGGAFFNGVLATVLATPCTAPFLSPALGFAFAQTFAVIFVIFLAAGLGLAAPYVILSWHPAWLKFLPRPGAWMEKFKIAMGFPMLATALWLFGLLPVHYGERSWWLALFLVFLALSAWIFGEFVQRGHANRSMGTIASICVLLLGYFWALEHKLQWRSADTEQANGTSSSHTPAGIQWQAWNPQAVDEGRKDGRLVLIDFTANWCLTCNTIVKPALENPRVREKLTSLNAITLLGDYSRRQPLITEQLESLGHPGVPLVVIYPKNPAQSPLLLPDPAPLSLPSQYASLILEYLDRATH